MSKPTTKIEVPVSGGNLALFRFGATQGQPVLLIHGVTSSNRAFQFFADELIARGKVPYAVDLRGRGDSNHLPGPFGMAQHAKDIADVIKFLKLDRPDVIGHSMGGFVLAALVGIYPESIGNAYFADGGIPLPMPPGMSVDQIMPLVLGPALARLAMHFESNEAYREYWKPQPAFTRGWSAELDEYVDYDLRNGKPSTNPQAVEEDSRDLFGDDLVSRSLKELQKEALFIRAPRGLQNEEGGLYPPAIIEAALHTYPKLKLVNLVDVNHYEMFLTSVGSMQVAQIIYGDR
jgi:pimeloyl-ACP methyl ester carboxylesterase